MAVDVVVVNYHTDDLLVQFLESYRAHAFEGCTITVVEVEKDPTASTGVPMPGVDSLVIFGENVGYGKACNAGALKGKNDVVLLANADTILSSQGLGICHAALMSREDWGVLGPRQVDELGRITAGGIFGHPASPSQRGWQETDFGQYCDVRDDALTVSGSLYFIKRSLWAQLSQCSSGPASEGAFLETPHYFDETWCSYHARAHGYKCVYYGPVQMIHGWHKSSSHGGWADQQFKVSQEMHRTACANHTPRIECE